MENVIYPAFITKKPKNKYTREWKSEEEIIKEHAKYNTKGKANIIGWTSQELAREIAEVSHFLYVVTLGYIHVYILPDGYTITHRINYN